MSIELLNLLVFKCLHSHEQEAIEFLHHKLSNDPRISQGIIIGGYKSYESDGKEYDCIAYLEFKKPEELEFYARNLLFALEIKGHREFCIKDNDIVVEYNGKETPVLYPFFNKSLPALKNLINRIEPELCRWVYGAIFFSHLNSDRISSKDLSHELISKSVVFRNNFSIDRLLKIFANQRTTTDMSSLNVLPAGGNMVKMIKKCLGLEERKIKQTELDRKKLERITTRKIRGKRVPKYMEKLGTQFLYITGKAGTGKTITLLSLACSISASGLVPLIITYNHALAADLRRLITILKEAGEVNEEIKVVTIVGLMFRVARTLRALEDKEYWEPAEDFDERYEERIGIIKQCMEDRESQTYRDIILEEHPELKADFILVDEGQDWREEEKEFLRWIAGTPDKLIVAIGPDQVTRKKFQYQRWFLDYENRQAYILKENMRQKGRLHRFNKLLSEKILNDYDWTYNKEDLGEGEIRILPDSELYKKKFWEELELSLRKNGNEPVDCLIIEPNVIPSQHNIKKTKDILLDLGLDFWDGTEIEIRRSTFPKDNSQYRIVKYASCRGLEGWVVIVRLVDIQYSQTMTDKQKAAPSLFATKEAESEIVKELRIALTRGIDSLFITYRDAQHPFVMRLKELAGEAAYL